MDRHSSNRKNFLHELCRGEMKLSMTNPNKEGSQVYFHFGRNLNVQTLKAIW
uniref:Uncharacterized protein n=1 Tax=Lepeophtheirus salmonis TaxID=72036 RepID=A0A0K2TGI8_LEPSM